MNVPGPVSTSATNSTIPNAAAVAAAKQALEEIKKAKAIEFFAAAQAAQFDARLELDKSLLTLSSAGIAAFVALLTTVGPGTDVVAYCSCFAIACFVLVIVFVLVSFALSADYLDALLADKSPSERGLKRVDSIARGFFILSILASATVGVSMAKSFIEHKVNLVANEKPIDPEQLADAIKRGEVPVLESLRVTTNHLSDYTRGLETLIAQASQALSISNAATVSAATTTPHAAATPVQGQATPASSPAATAVPAASSGSKTP